MPPDEEDKFENETIETLKRMHEAENSIGLPVFVYDGDTFTKL